MKLNMIDNFIIQGCHRGLVGRGGMVLWVVQVVQVVPVVEVQAEFAISTSH